MKRSEIIKFGMLNPYYIAKSRLLFHIDRVSGFASGLLLDVGCGDKKYLPLFQKRISCYIGMDIPRSGDQADIMGTALSLPFRRGALDTVLCNEVLEHLPEPSVFFSEAFSVLKPGGYLILTTPQVWGLHEIPHDYYRYTRYGLEYLSEKSGFTVVKISSTCGTFGVIGQRLNSFLFNRCSRNIFTKVFIIPVIFIVNLCSVALDTLFNHEGDTLDNVLIARKGATKGEWK